MRRAGAFLLLVVLGCSDDATTSARADGGAEAADAAPDAPALPAAPLFVQEPAGEPVIHSGVAGWPVLVADPMVLRDDEGYHLFYTTPFCKRANDYHFSFDPAAPAECSMAGFVGTIGYAFSSDRGMSWSFRPTPLLVPGPEEWNDHSIETAFAVRDGDRLHLLFSAHGHHQGQPFYHRYQVGLASLELAGASIKDRLIDGTAVFTKRAEPLLPFDLQQTSFTNNTQEPSVVREGDGYDVYFVGLGLGRPDKDIADPSQAIASVGMGVARFDLELDPLQAPQPLLPGANITEVRRIDDVYRVFATTLESGEFHRGERLSYAASVDRQVWSAPTVVMEPGPPSAFDDWGIMAPTVVTEHDAWVMFYTAWGVADHPCYPIPADGRIGIPVDGDTRCVFGTLARAIADR